MTTELNPVYLGSETSTKSSQELSISTWNVWFDRFHREERNNALLSELGQYKPDIMVFQEVTMPFIRAAQACEWLREGYWISATDHNQIGVVMISRLPAARVFFHQLTSEMGRRLLVADFSNIAVASGHFESNRGSGSVRQKQFQESIEFLSRYPRAVLAGDFNCTAEDAESERLNAHFVDAWDAKGEGPGYTLDTFANERARRDARCDLQVRIDRVLLQGDLKVQSISLLGTEAFQENVHASDHFGLLSDIVSTT